MLIRSATGFQAGRAFSGEVGYLVGLDLGWSSCAVLKS
jgi:hypothetical protein